MLSGAIFTQVVSSVLPSPVTSARAAGRLEKGRSARPSTSPPPASVPPMMKLRRESAISARLRRGVDRRANPAVGPAPTHIGDGCVDLRVARVGLELEQQSDRGHDLAGLTVAALRNLVRGPGLLHVAHRLAVVPALDR